MTQRKSPPRPAGLGGAAVAAPSAGAALTATQPKYTPTSANLSTPIRDLPGLALEAARRVSEARLLVACCQAAGDRQGWEYWRRQLLAHQAIWWAATHPQEVAP